MTHLSCKEILRESHYEQCQIIYLLTPHGKLGEEEGELLEKAEEQLKRRQEDSSTI